ncbi:MAG: hypothetical protein QOG80_3120 [Pseudonocardiales bacterium]|nr:hypothetical protein [Pseudonocardiales bacterium]
MSARPPVAVERLPGGRRGSSGLTRAQVAAHQRRRILSALAQTVAEKGFPAATVADVIAVAGVSRATFYQQFDDLSGCFLAAFDAASQRVMAALRAVRTSDLELLLAAYLDVLSDDPAVAKVFLVDIFALGPEGIGRRAASQRRFAAVVAELVGATTAADRFACEAFVAAAATMVTTRVAAADLPALRVLRAPLAELADRMLRG